MNNQPDPRLRKIPNFDFYGYFEIDIPVRVRVKLHLFISCMVLSGESPHHFPSLSFSRLCFNFDCLSLSLGRDGLPLKKMGLAS